jgi:hypothetical protein
MRRFQRRRTLYRAPRRQHDLELTIVQMQNPAYRSAVCAAGRSCPGADNLLE